MPNPAAGGEFFRPLQMRPLDSKSNIKPNQDSALGSTHFAEVRTHDFHSKGDDSNLHRGLLGDGQGRAGDARGTFRGLPGDEWGTFPSRFIAMRNTYIHQIQLVTRSLFLPKCFFKHAGMPNPAKARQTKPLHARNQTKPPLPIRVHSTSASPLRA